MAKTRKALTEHVKGKHVGYPCKDCNMVFDHRQKLKNHHFLMHVQPAMMLKGLKYGEDYDENNPPQ